MELVVLNGKNTAHAVKIAAAALKKGGIIAYPTDTVYGLGVDVTNKLAIEHLRQLKGRERKRPISVIVPDVASIEECGHLTPLAKQFAEKHLPGALTLVIPAKDRMPDSLTLNGSIGIRIPDEPFCLALAKEFGPYTTTSANKTGLGTPRTAEELMAHFRMELPFLTAVIDGGPRDSASPSTVVSCLTDTPYVLRQGALSREELGL